MPELWRNNPRTSRNRNSVPRLLTKIQDMWLLDLREPPKESGHRPQRDSRTRKVPHKQCPTQDPNPQIRERERSVIFQLHSFASRRSTGFDISRMVTDLVTANGNGPELSLETQFWERGSTTRILEEFKLVLFRSHDRPN